MPTFNSTTYGNQIGGQARNRVDASIGCGELRYVEVEYKFLATEAAGDILKLYQMPPGVVIYAEDIKVSSEGIGGTTVTFTALGDQAVANRYSTTAIALTAAGYVSVTPVVATTLPRVVIVAGTNDVIQGTLGGTLPATANKRIWIRIPYRLV
jgi:hypothetical protein